MEIDNEFCNITEELLNIVEKENDKEEKSIEIKVPEKEITGKNSSSSESSIRTQSTTLIVENDPTQSTETDSLSSSQDEKPSPSICETNNAALSLPVDDIKDGDKLIKDVEIEEKSSSPLSLPEVEVMEVDSDNDDVIVDLVVAKKIAECIDLISSEEEIDDKSSKVISPKKAVISNQKPLSSDSSSFQSPSSVVNIPEKDAEIDSSPSSPAKKRDWKPLERCNPKEKSKKPISDSNKLKKKSWMCNICEKLCPTKSMIKAHKMLHAAQAIETDGNELKRKREEFKEATASKKSSKLKLSSDLNNLQKNNSHGRNFQSSSQARQNTEVLIDSAAKKIVPFKRFLHFCDTCNLSFKNRKAFGRHYIKTGHKNKRSVELPVEKQGAKKSSTAKETLFPFFCELCNIGFRLIKEFTDHNYFNHNRKHGAEISHNIRQYHNNIPFAPFSHFNVADKGPLDSPYGNRHLGNPRSNSLLSNPQGHSVFGDPRDKSLPRDRSLLNDPQGKGLMDNRHDKFSLSDCCDNSPLEDSWHNNPVLHSESKDSTFIAPNAPHSSINVHHSPVKDGSQLVSRVTDKRIHKCLVCSEIFTDKKQFKTHNEGHNRRRLETERERREFFSWKCSDEEVIKRHISEFISSIRRQTECKKANISSATVSKKMSLSYKKDVKSEISNLTTENINDRAETNKEPSKASSNTVTNKGIETCAIVTNRDQQPFENVLNSSEQKVKNESNSQPLTVDKALNSFEQGGNIIETKQIVPESMEIQAKFPESDAEMNNKKPETEQP